MTNIKDNPHYPDNETPCDNCGDTPTWIDNTCLHCGAVPLCSKCRDFHRAEREYEAMLKRYNPENDPAQW